MPALLISARTTRCPVVLRCLTRAHSCPTPKGAARRADCVVAGQLRGCQYGRPSSMPSSLLPTSARGLRSEIDVIIESRRVGGAGGGGGGRSRRAASRQAAAGWGPAASRSPYPTILGVPLELPKDGPNSVGSLCPYSQ